MNKSAINIPFEIKDDWFNKFHVSSITQEFMDWWVKYYGVPSDYYDQHDYYIRMSFALGAWRAANQARGKMNNEPS